MAHEMGLLNEEVRSDTASTLEHGAMYSLDASFVQDERILAIFRPSELMNLTAGLLAKLDSEMAEKIAECRAQADPNGDIDSQFEEVTDFLDHIRYLVEADEVFESKYRKLIAELEQAKESVEAEKSDDDEESSFFNTVPRAMQREQDSGRSVFSDVDE
jgi:hypothetical protein